MAYKIEYYCVSHTGKRRAVNQDNFICDGTYMNYQNEGTGELLCGEREVTATFPMGVFDGMGGEECGEMAVYLAAKRMSETSFKKDSVRELKEYCRFANEDICRYTLQQNLTSMGTTMALLLFEKKQIHLCNIGDSKIYHMSHDKLQQISHDHVGLAAYGKKPPLTQNLGIPEEELLISPYFATKAYREGDIFLICSDGLTDMVDEETIAEILLTTTKAETGKQLLQKALDNGGRDNITFLLIYVKKDKSRFLFF